jgi:hypothetical protein
MNGSIAADIPRSSYALLQMQLPDINWAYQCACPSTNFLAISYLLASISAPPTPTTVLLTAILIFLLEMHVLLPYHDEIINKILKSFLER